MRIRKKKCLKNCKTNDQFVVFPYGISAALRTHTECPSSDWLHLAADIRSLPTFSLSLEPCPLSRHTDP